MKSQKRKTLAPVISVRTSRRAAAKRQHPAAVSPDAAPGRLPPDRTAEPGSASRGKPPTRSDLQGFADTISRASTAEGSPGHANAAQDDPTDICLTEPTAASQIFELRPTGARTEVAARTVARAERPLGVGSPDIQADGSERPEPRPMNDRARRYARELQRFYEALKDAESAELDERLEQIERGLFEEYASCSRDPLPQRKKLLN